MECQSDDKENMRSMAAEMERRTRRAATGGTVQSLSRGRASSALVAGALLIASVSGPADAVQNWQWAVSANLTRERVVGLLSLPEIVGDGCGPTQPASTTLYAGPAATTESVGSIIFRVADRQPDGGSCGSAQLLVQVAGGADEELPVDEVSYEIPAAIVYEQSGTWFRVALQRGSAWITRTDSNDFQSYPDLLKERLAYVRKGWAARLWQAPGQGPGTRIPTAWSRYLADNIPVEVLDVQRVNGVSWIRVRLQTESCGETLAGVEPATGWIPAYQTSGRPAVWFYARGC